MLEAVHRVRSRASILLLLVLAFAGGICGSAQDMKTTPAEESVAATWPPPNVDDNPAPAMTDVTCQLPEILQGVTHHVRDLVGNLREFTATERLDHQHLKPDGKWSPTESRAFKYLVDLHEAAPGMLLVDEYRTGRPGELHPGGLQDLGLPALALVFHPEFANEYRMSCEGLGQWRGQAAWRVRFEQVPDRTSRLRAFVVGSQSFPIRLKGRAWISAENFQLLRLETDLLTPIPQIRLFLEHIAVEYRAVRFQQRNVELWLPDSAEIYLDYHGRRYRRRHTFSDFLLFAVDVNERVSAPQSHDPGKN